MDAIDRYGEALVLAGRRAAQIDSRWASAVSLRDGLPASAGHSHSWLVGIGKLRLVFGVLAVAAIAATLFFTVSSTRPDVNIAAAAYAATSPQQGATEAVWFTRILTGSQRGQTLRQREWIDPAAGRRREQSVVSDFGAGSAVSQVDELATAPGFQESWEGTGQPDVVERMRVHSDYKSTPAFGGITLAGLEGVKLYRQLYRTGAIRLVGHERHYGRNLWKLESHPVSSLEREIHTRLIVLVDPHSFLPLSERQIDIALPGHPTVVESNLLSFRHLQSEEVKKTLFELAPQHPHAHLVTRPGIFPKFRVMRHRGRRHAQG